MISEDVRNHRGLRGGSPDSLGNVFVELADGLLDCLFDSFGFRSGNG